MALGILIDQDVLKIIVSRLASMLVLKAAVMNPTIKVFLRCNSKSVPSICLSLRSVFVYAALKYSIVVTNNAMVSKTAASIVLRELCI